MTDLISSVDAWTSLPVGARVVPYGYPDSMATTRRHDGMFVSARGVCSPKHMGIPARLLPGRAEVPAPSDVFAGVRQ